MNNKVWRVVLVVFLTFGLSVLVVERIHATETCSASASAGKSGASGSVSPGASHLPIDHDVNDEYRGVASVKLVVDGTTHQKIGERIWVVVKEKTEEVSYEKEDTTVLAAGAEIIVPGRIISKVTANGKVTVTYRYKVKETKKKLYTETEGVSHSASGQKWHEKSAIAFGFCGNASDCDGWKTYTPSGIWGWF